MLIKAFPLILYEVTIAMMGTYINNHKVKFITMFFIDNTQRIITNIVVYAYTFMCIFLHFH